MNSALQWAKYIVTKCVNDDEPISNLQLQKILYFIQKDFLQHGKRAFPDRIEAWQYGPVVPPVYYFFCGFGSMDIIDTYDVTEIRPEDAAIADKIIEQKRKMPPWSLVEETHKEGGAWDQTFDGGRGNRQVIKPEVILVEQ